MWQRSRHSVNVRVGGQNPDGSQTIAVDLYNTEREFVILTVPLLGLDDPADIDISAIGNEITIRVDTAPDSKIPPHVYLLRERRFGRFERKINLPAAIRPEGITAELLRNHVLRIRVPRR